MRNSCWVVMAVVVMGVAGVRGQDLPAGVPHVNHAGLLAMKWQLLAGTDSFGDMTAFEMIDLLHGMTIHHLELSTQPLSAEHRDVMVGPGMGDAMVDALLAKVKSHHMDVVTWVAGLQDRASRRDQFEFAHRLGVKNLIVPGIPTPADDKLANLFRINVAGDNRFNQSIKAQLDAGGMVEDLKDLSPRSGMLVAVPPGLAAMIRTLGSRAIEIHLDGNGADDLAVCRQLKDQHFVGQIEVSSGWSSVPHVVMEESLQDRRGGFIRSLDAFSDAVTKATGIAEK